MVNCTFDLSNKLKTDKMILTENHRSALLDALEKELEERDLQKRCMDKEKDESLKEYFELKHFLALNRIHAIKKAILTNEIDY